MNKATGTDVDTLFRYRILVIEDSYDIRFFLKALLEGSYEVTVAVSGEAGLQMVMSDKRPPDIILLDVMMPNMDGYQVLDRLRRNSHTADIPVIFLTVLSSVEEEQRGLDMGAVDYVTKPISPPILLSRVRLHLERSTNAKRLKDLSEQLSHYLAPQVYQSLFEGSRQAAIQTQRKKLTVFFSDIEDFTGLTAQWQPEEVTLLLNSYFAEMSQIAAEYGATLDKFIGDAIVIFFGDPHTLGIHKDAIQCVKMAIAMQKRMDELRIRWQDMGINKTFKMRIGINSGFCNVGNFGSNLRMDYTIIGREVNLAARLEQAAQPGEILISSETYALVQSEIQADKQEPFLVKGFPEPIMAYAVHPDSISLPDDSEIIQCDRPGTHIKINIGWLTIAERLNVAAELRKIIEKLEVTSIVGPESEAASFVDIVLPETIAGLDVTLGLARAAGQKTLYLSMLRHYIDWRKDSPTQIRQSLNDDDLEKAELLSHSLRGMSEQIGATQVSFDAQALEQAINEGQSREMIDKLLEQLDVSLSGLITTLDSFMREK